MTKNERLFLQSKLAALGWILRVLAGNSFGKTLEGALEQCGERYGITDEKEQAFRWMLDNYEAASVILFSALEVAGESADSLLRVGTDI